MEKEIINLNDEMIENMIYEIRGQTVMLDFELAKILGYETKTLNQQVRNNLNKFELNQRFQLTKNELENLARSKFSTAQAPLRSKFLTAQEKIWATNKGGRTTLPYAFAEQGIYTLLTVLKGEAVNINGKKIIDYFNNLKNAKIWPSEAKNLDIVKFESGGIILDVNVSPNEDTVWLTQNDMAILYDTTKQLICFHINNIFDQNELEKEAVVKKNLTTAIDGKTYNMTYYNLNKGALK